MIDLNVNYADEFADLVEANKSDYPKSIKNAVKRYRKWSKRDDIWMDIEKANAMMLFSEMFCRHSKGEWAGQPIELELWQKFFFTNIYGWQTYDEERKQNRRVVRNIFLQVPKKNGKTLMGTLPVIYGIYGEGLKGADLYVSATTFDQAQNAAGPIAATIVNSPDLIDGTRIFKGKNNTIKGVAYTFEDENGIKHTNKLDVLSKGNDSTEGKNPYLTYKDEVHVERNFEQYDNLKSAQVAQLEPINLVTTTAGKDTQALGPRIYSYVSDVLKNDNDDSWFVMIYEPDKGYDWEDEDVWRMVNPNIGLTVTMSFLRSEFKEAKKSAHKKAEFMSKHLDVYVNYADTYFDLDQVETMLVDDLGDILGKPCVVGLDLSKRVDLTCVSINVIDHDDEGRAIEKVKQMYFIPQEGIVEKENLRNVPYRDLAEKGFVTLCPGKTVDYDMILDYVEWIFDNFEIMQLNYDKAMSEKLIEDIEMRFGIQCVEVPQYPAVMNEAVDDFEVQLLNRRVVTDNPLLIFCISNAMMVTNINGEKAPTKRKSPEHIDGFVAYLIGHKESMNYLQDVEEDAFEDYLNDIFN
ncbi:terminase large subunit [Macrococcoides bohemicum]|uniref:Terminase large subunit n=1 Tax=Macrococcoides bohemicum TaxID=1903056 RepID=A0A328A918_9STAP|nr:terminase TerL endonuclease subunit [Macrococcus bohemicus]RAK50194.1 terminase large subunit [Macrococcus bohemicus]